MVKVKPSLDKLKVWIVKSAQLDKGQCIDEKYSWTIYLLVDLKIVYIITFAFITVVNLISSTANGEAISDANSMALVNVTLSPGERNVQVKSINDAVLWNCRSESVTSYYYRFLYWMLIIALCVSLLGFWVIKLIGLITVNCTCKTCSCPCAYIEYGLTKLWHIAILEHRAESCGHIQHSRSRMRRAIQNERNSQQSQNGDDPQKHNMAQVDIENRNELVNVYTLDSMLQGPPDNEIMGSNQSVKAKTDDAEVNVYQTLLEQEAKSNVLEGLGCCSRFANFCRQIIPGILLCLSVMIMGLSYLSYDLHPLACIVIPAEEYIQYNATTKKVQLEFSHRLRTFQAVAGWVVLGLTASFLLLVYLFYRASIKVVNDIKSKVDEEIRELQSRHGPVHAITTQPLAAAAN